MNNPPVNLSQKFTITYTGNIYKKGHNPMKVLIALSNLISYGGVEPHDISVRFYGSGQEWLGKWIKYYGLSEVVELCGEVSREKALEKQRESQVLLSLKWEKHNEAGIYSGKLFEYLAAKRPILAVGGGTHGGYSSKIFEYLAAERPILAVGGYPDVVNELLDETKAGIWAGSVDDIEKAIYDMYQEYKNKGQVNYVGDVDKVSKYTHSNMAKKFVEVLNAFV